MIAVSLSTSLSFSSLLGHLAAAITISPLFNTIGSETKNVHHDPEFGIVMMLLMIGLSLNPHALCNIHHRLLGLGELQLGLTSRGTMLGAMGLGYMADAKLVIRLILVLSSTTIVLQTLLKRNLNKSHGERFIFVVSLTQDIKVMPILALLLPLGLKHGVLQQD